MSIPLNHDAGWLCDSLDQVSMSVHAAAMALHTPLELGQIRMNTLRKVELSMLMALSASGSHRSQPSGHV